MGGAVARPTVGTITPETAHRVTVTLQKMDISVQPVGKLFDVTLSIRKDLSGPCNHRYSHDPADNWLQQEESQF